MWRWVVGIIVVVAIIVGGTQWVLSHPELLSGEQQKPKVIPTTRPMTKDLEQTVLATGDVRPILTSDIKSEVSGRIQKVYVRAGDKVTKNQKLVDLDPSELLTQKQANELTINGVKLRLKKNREEWERNQALFKQHLIPEKEYLDSRTDMEMAENDLNIEGARLSTIEEQLKKTTISAPHDGIVLNLDAQEGNVIVGASSVSSGSILMTVANLTRLRVNTNINEIDVTNLKNDMTVELSFDSVPGLKVPGNITFVSPSAAGMTASSSSGSGGGGGGGGRNAGTDSSIRTFPVIIELISTDPRIRPGITAAIKIPIARVQQVLTIPISTVYTDDSNEDHYVFLKKADTFERKNIKIGIGDLMDVQVKEGLSPEDNIATEIPVENNNLAKRSPRRQNRP